MRARIATALLLGLLLAAPAKAQQQVVNVELDLRQIAELAELPPQADLKRAQDGLRTQFIGVLNRRILGCWRFQPVQGAAASPLIRIVLDFTTLDSSTRDLAAHVLLVRRADGRLDSLIGDKPLILANAGTIATLKGQYWEEVFRYLYLQFEFKLTYLADKPSLTLIEQRIPIATGILKHLVRGAVLPIPWLQFGKYSNSEYELHFVDSMRGLLIVYSKGAEQSVSMPGNARFIRILHEKLREADSDLVPYNPTQHDPRLQQLQLRQVYLLKVGTNPAFDSEYELIQ